MDLSAPLVILQVLHTRPSWGDFTLKFGRVRVLYVCHAYSSCCLFPDPLFSKIRYVVITQNWHNSCHLWASEMVQVPEIFIPGFQMCVLSHVTCLSQDHIFAHKIKWGSIWIEGAEWKSHGLIAPCNATIIGSFPVYEQVFVLPLRAVIVSGIFHYDPAEFESSSMLLSIYISWPQLIRSFVLCLLIIFSALDWNLLFWVQAYMKRYSFSYNYFSSAI